MKRTIKTLLTIVLLSPVPLFVYGQGSPDAYSILLVPPEARTAETGWDGERMWFVDNGVSLDIRQGAGTYARDTERALEQIWIEITLRSESAQIRPFTDNVGISFDETRTYYPDLKGANRFALPDASEGFLPGVPYDVKLFFGRFDRQLSGDSLNIMLHLPPVRSQTGTVLIDAREIPLKGDMPES